MDYLAKKYGTKKKKKTRKHKPKPLHFIIHDDTPGFRGDTPRKVKEEETVKTPLPSAGAQDLEADSNILQHLNDGSGWKDMTSSMPPPGIIVPPSSSSSSIKAESTSSSVKRELTSSSTSKAASSGISLSLGGAPLREVRVLNAEPTDGGMTISRSQLVLLDSEQQAPKSRSGSRSPTPAVSKDRSASPRMRMRHDTDSEDSDSEDDSRGRRRHDTDSEEESPPHSPRPQAVEDSRDKNSLPPRESVELDSDGDLAVPRPPRIATVDSDSDGDLVLPRDHRTTVTVDSDDDLSTPTRPQLLSSSDRSSTTRRLNGNEGIKREKPRRKSRFGTSSSTSARHPKRMKSPSNEISTKPSKRLKSSRTSTSPPRHPPSTAAASSVAKVQRKVGLQTGKEFGDSLREIQSRQMAAESKDANESGKNAPTVYRDKRGRVVLPGEKEKKKRLKEKEKEEKRKDKLKKKIKRKKPKYEKFSRHADDRDLNIHQMERDRWDDPMGEVIAKKRRKKMEMNLKEDAERRKRLGKSERVLRPMYTGPRPPANRFNIRPGHRWDGVDRSNGWEAQRFRIINEQKAHAEDGYKLSAATM